jgi:chromosome segregation ATPase
MELDQEKFNKVKELADIHANLSDARVEIQKLKETTEEYMVVREQEAEERVLKVLKESREALEETSKNHDELTRFSNEVKAYAIELKGLASDITALFQDFGKRVEEADEDVKKNQEIVSDILTKIKVERVQVREDRKLLEAEQYNINEQLRLLKDKRESFERAWEELKKLQSNKENI